MTRLTELSDRNFRILAPRLLFLVVLSGCARDPAQTEVPIVPPRVVRVARADLTSQPILTEVVGTVRAVRSATIAPLISGTVSEVRVGLGTPVKAGDVLVRLSAGEVHARLEQTRAVYALAKRDGDRATALRNQEVISTAQYDTALSQLKVAEARQLEASTLADRTVLRAPFAGVITDKRIHVGETAMPGQTLLVLEAPGALRFEARVPEGAGEGLAIGRTLPLRLDGLDQETRGRIAEVEPASDDLTRTRLLKLDLPDLPRLQSGRFGRLLLSTGESLAVTVPADAVVRHGQLEMVFVFDAGTARLRLVRTGRERDGWLEIASGLSGGEGVVISGAQALIDGQRVEEAK